MHAAHDGVATAPGRRAAVAEAAYLRLAGVQKRFGGFTALESIDLVFPKEGLGWDLEAFGIHKGTKKLDAAKKLADWASSKDAMLLYGKNFAITAQPGLAPPLANVPKDYEARLVKMDFGWAAENRERLLNEWTKRYNSKTEKR